MPRMVSRSRETRGPAIRLGVTGFTAAVAGIVTVTGLVDWSSVWAWISRHALPLAFFVLAVIFGSAAAVRVFRDPGRLPRRPNVPALTWWMIAGAAGVVAVATWIATGILLHEADRANDRAAARVDAVKTGLGVAAGTGGIFALLLAVRRQWHQEFTTLETARDAESRRITELYTKAAEQLGSEKAAVRLAGLYSLERLAGDNPPQQQTIVNVVCAYLRMPPEATAPPVGDPAESDRISETQVRLEAQAILAKHLKETDAAGQRSRSYWPEIDVDLTGAKLADLNLSHCHPRSVVLRDARLSGHIDFSGITADDAIDLSAAEFTGTSLFRDGRFPIATDFSRTGFRAAVDFTGSAFAGAARFASASFDDKALFERLEVTLEADFQAVKALRHIDFAAARFGGLLDFREARIQGAANFRGAVFTRDAMFHGARFGSRADFGDARFERAASFDGARFTGLAEFTGCGFTGVAGYEQTRFTSGFRFRRIKATGVAEFRGAPWIRMDVTPAVLRDRSLPRGFEVTEVSSPPRQVDKGSWARLTKIP
jgi:uncharacterized protein YjbI with pentapeptide repeats